MEPSNWTKYYFAKFVVKFTRTCCARASRCVSPAIDGVSCWTAGVWMLCGLGRSARMMIDGRNWPRASRRNVDGARYRVNGRDESSVICKFVASSAITTLKMTIAIINRAILPANECILSLKEANWTNGRSINAKIKKSEWIKRWKWSGGSDYLAVKSQLR